MGDNRDSVLLSLDPMPGRVGNSPEERASVQQRVRHPLIAEHKPKQASY